MSGIPTSVTVPQGDTWTELVAPVVGDSIVVIQQFRSGTDWDFTFAASAPAVNAPCFTHRPDMGRDWVSWNVTGGHGVYARHLGLDGDRLFTVTVEDQ